MVLFKSQIGFYVRLKTFQRANINDAAVLVCWSHFFYWNKSWNDKRYSFANVEFICHWDRANSIKTNLQTFNLQTGFSKAVLSEFAPSIWQKVFQIIWQKHFTFENGYLFHTWTFSIIEEIASGYFYLDSNCQQTRLTERWW